MRPAIPILLVVGILLGPVYYAYCLLLSGQKIQTIEMTERASRWVTPDGSILRFTNGLAYKPVALALRPDMNRVALRLNFTFSGGSTKGSPIELHYQATLVQLDHTVLERPLFLRVTRAGTQSTDIGPLEIPYPAEYLFLLEEAGNPELVPVLSLEVIEKIETPVRAFVWTGLALLIIAAIIAMRDAVRAMRLRRRH
jgi:hypothetical protein